MRCQCGLRRCGLNTCIQYFSGLPGFADALLDASLTARPLTRAVATAVQRSLAEGPSVVGDLSQLIELLRKHPGTRQRIQEGPRCFLTNCASCHASSAILLPEQLQTKHSACSGVLVDVDVRELVEYFLQAIHGEVTQAMQELQTSLQIDLDQVRAPQLARLCHARAATTSFIVSFQSWCTYFCRPAG